MDYLTYGLWLIDDVLGVALFALVVVASRNEDRRVKEHIRRMKLLTAAYVTKMLRHRS